MGKNIKVLECQIYIPTSIFFHLHRRGRGRFIDGEPRNTCLWHYLSQCKGRSEEIRWKGCDLRNLPRCLSCCFIEKYCRFVSPRHVLALVFFITPFMEWSPRGEQEADNEIYPLPLHLSFYFPPLLPPSPTSPRPYLSTTLPLPVLTFPFLFLVLPCRTEKGCFATSGLVLGSK